MNYSDRFLRETATYSTLDVMLADIAVRIQLPPSDYQKAVDHYEAVSDWLDRPDSVLHGRVELMYPQGGFMIGATTARHTTEADFDIDVVAQVDWGPQVDPEAALSTLHKAIRGEPGSRYYAKAERKTRCSTIHYDGMHLDVTPAVRLVGLNEKVSCIFHSKPSDPSVPKQTLFANPYGFGEWFNIRTPADEIFATYFEKASLDYDRMRLEVLAKADAEPVPPQMPIYRKSRALIALQLIKRWRGLLYDRHYPNRRMPPSVLLALYVGQHANQTRTLADELIHQVESMIAILVAAERFGSLVHEVNPTCEQDVFTDRWPGTDSDQRIFLKELRGFVHELRRLQEGVPLQEMQRILEGLFGERPAREAIRKFADQHVKDTEAGRSFHIARTGSIPALGSAAVPTGALATPNASPWGDK